MYRLTTMSECVYITLMIIPEQCVVVDVVMKRRKACYGMKLDLKNGGHPSIPGFNEPSWEKAW